MKQRFILFRRAGVFYYEDTTTGQQLSLRTKDEAEALTLLHSKNEAHRQLNPERRAFYRLAWHLGASQRAKTAGYGLRLGTYRDQMIDRSWKTVVLELVGGPTIQVEITSGFWKKCSELLHPEIGRWFHELS